MSLMRVIFVKDLLLLVRLTGRYGSYPQFLELIYTYLSGIEFSYAECFIIFQKWIFQGFAWCQNMKISHMVNFCSMATVNNKQTL